MNIRNGNKFYDDEYPEEEERSKVSSKNNMYSKIQEFRDHYNRDPEYKDREYMARKLYPSEENITIDVLVAIYYSIIQREKK